MQAGPGGKVVLPHRVQVFYLGVAEAPWTNIKTLNALIWVNLTGVGLTIGALFDLKIDNGILEMWLFFLAGLLGISMIGAGIKRATYKPSPPYGPDIEDAQAGATAEPEAPTGNRPGTTRVTVTTTPFGGSSQ